MNLAIDFDGKQRRGAVKVDDVRPGGMLAAEAMTAGSFAKFLPEANFGWSHPAA